MRFLPKTNLQIRPYGINALNSSGFGVCDAIGDGAIESGETAITLEPAPEGISNDLAV